MVTRTSDLIEGPPRAAPWRIELLGGIRALRGRRIVTGFRTRRAAILLARLALNPRAHRRDELMAMLWPETPVAAARQNLSQSLSELRRRLEPPHECEFLLASRETVWIDRDHLDTDVMEFERELERARGAGGAERMRHLERAVSIADAELLPGVEYDWAAASRERISAECDAALHDLVRWHEGVGDLAAAFEFAWRRVRIDPLDEGAHRDFAHLFERAGRPAAALQHLQTFERDLERRAVAGPDEQTRAMIAALRARLAGELLPTD